MSAVNDLSGHIRQGKHDSVVRLAGWFYRQSLLENDTATAFYTGVMAAQSFFFLNEMDSVKRYIDVLTPMAYVSDSPTAKTIFYNVVASYWLLSELNYSKALTNYIEGLRWAEMDGSANNQISLLANIVNIFYLLGNPNGYEYAERARELAAESDITAYTKSAVMITMAQVLYLEGRLIDEKKYLDSAEIYVKRHNLVSNYAIVNVLYAKLYEAMGKTEEAVMYYKNAINNVQFTDPGTVADAYLHYGKLLEKTGRERDALSMYEQGLRLSYKSGSLEYRKEMLNCAAELSYRLGLLQTSYQHSHQYRLLEENVANHQASDFNELLLAIQKMRHDRQIMEQQLAQRKTEMRLTVTIFIAVVALLLVLSLLYVYYRQKKAYRTIVEQHRSYMDKLDRQQALTAESVHLISDNNDADKVLFDRIEQTMRTARFYLRKDASLELLAEELATNRTYCSRAINTIAHMSFNRYVDSFRIEEATRQIMARGKDILFKQLADDLGYNSVTVFHKAFIREIGCSPGVYRKEILAAQHKKEAS